ncbi:hypothetical protein TMEC54S_00337 [Thauera mechernichensis]|uniref:hypothetical protein n=1 Tax=Thauera sp. 27 TaxID=305700 RepID=UPI0002CF9141|nr:hypothetical protein [Thauera sp. 27]ENO79028.1 hypothetical protein B447_13664 [Thauera sp. 27]
MRFNYFKAAEKVANALQAASVLTPAGAELLLGADVLEGEGAVMLVIYIAVFVLFNLLAAIVAGFEDDST